MDINNMTTEEIQVVLKRREYEQKELDKPQPVENPDFGEVIKCAVDYIEALSNGDYIDDDTDYWFFDAVTRAVYLAGVCKWITKNT